jgi:hypothetical protein
VHAHTYIHTHMRSLVYHTESKPSCIIIVFSPTRVQLNILLFFMGCAVWNSGILCCSGNLGQEMPWMFLITNPSLKLRGAWLMRRCLKYQLTLGCAMSPSLYGTLKHKNTHTLERGCIYERNGLFNYASIAFPTCVSVIQVYTKGKRGKGFV